MKIPQFEKSVLNEFYLLLDKEEIVNLCDKLNALSGKELGFKI